MAATPTSPLPTATPVEAPDSDGRRRRSQDSRARIVKAMLELVHAGQVSPAAEQVASRAQVGLRTVFRQFKDMDALYGEMSAVIEGELQTLLDRPLQASEWRDKILEIARRRAEVFEKIGPFKRASEVHRHRSKFLAAGQEKLVTLSREILRRQIPPEAGVDAASFEALDLMLSFEAWSRLRRDQGLPVDRAAEVVEQALRRLLA